jgi:hypothetical protein
LANDAIEHDTGNDLRLDRTACPKSLVLDQRNHGRTLGIEDRIVGSAGNVTKPFVRDARFWNEAAVVKHAAWKCVEPLVHPVGRAEQRRRVTLREVLEDGAYGERVGRATLHDGPKLTVIADQDVAREPLGVRSRRRPREFAPLRPG